MTFSQSDLPNIKWSLLIFFITLSIGSGAVYFSNKYALNGNRARLATQQQLNDARVKLNAARDDLENMAAYTKEYSAIHNREIIGDEHRLNLIEGLEKIRQRNRVLEFKYTIAPQQPYKPEPAVDSGNFELKLSPMTLQIDLLHEEQLINFFASLRRDMNGWFILNHCTLEKSTTSDAQLKADCTGGWLTMKNRNVK